MCRTRCGRLALAGCVLGLGLFSSDVRAQSKRPTQAPAVASEETASAGERADPISDGAVTGALYGLLASIEADAVDACVVGWHCTAGLVSAYAGIGALIDLGNRAEGDGSKRDSPWDGALIGLAIGLPIGMFNNNCDRARAWACVGQVAAFTSGVGLAMDLAHGPDTSAKKTRVTPIVSRGAVGVTMRVRWR